MARALRIEYPVAEDVVEAVRKYFNLDGVGKIFTRRSPCI
jgi:hypothetical protein